MDKGETKKKVTMDDIADRLSMSKSVVSRALHDKYGVNEETRGKVLVTALEMGYDFKCMTGGAKKSTGDICVFVPHTHLLDEAYYNKIIFGIENTLTSLKASFNLLISENNGYRETISRLKKLNSDGIIILGLLSYQNIVLAISSAIPTVLVDTLHYNFNIDQLTCSNYKGAYSATEYLLKQNHRRLAFLGATDYLLNFSDRYRGYRDCLERAGGAGVVDSSVVSPQSGDEYTVSYERIYDLFSGAGRPTGVLCANDHVAFKVYEIAESLNISIPGDLSVVGYDNIERCNWVAPKLTSVHVPKYEMGQESVFMLMRQIENRRRGIKNVPAKSVMLDTRLDVKESVRAL